jgi:hypothetical protein
MKVRMLVTTWTPKDGYAHTGDVLDVDKHTAERWFKFHIAEECSSSDGEQETSGMVEVKNADVLELPTSASPEVVVSSEEKQKKSERKKAKK